MISSMLYHGIRNPNPGFPPTVLSFRKPTNSLHVYDQRFDEERLRYGSHVLAQKHFLQRKEDVQHDELSAAIR